MHPNQVFRETESERNHALIATTGFGILAINGDQGPLISHIPYLYYRDTSLISFHLVRSNPIVRLLKGGTLPATLIVSGPHGYISPDWYGIENQVPTWNYVAVHAIGEVSLLPDDALDPLLERLSDHFEAALSPKPIWKMHKLTDDAKMRMMRQIVPCAMQVKTVDGTWKLGQNKPDDARLSAGDRLCETGFGAQVAVLAQLMRDSS